MGNGKEFFTVAWAVKVVGSKHLGVKLKDVTVTIWVGLREAHRGRDRKSKNAHSPTRHVAFTPSLYARRHVAFPKSRRCLISLPPARFGCRNANSKRITVEIFRAPKKRKKVESERGMNNQKGQIDQIKPLPQSSYILRDEYILIFDFKKISELQWRSKLASSIP